MPGAADVAGDHRVFDAYVAGVVVGHKEDRRAVSVDLVLLDTDAAQRQRHGVAVIVDRAAAAPARGAGFGRIAAVADGPVV